MKVQGGNGLEDANREILVEDLFQHTAGFGYAAGLPGQGGGDVRTEDSRVVRWSRMLVYTRLVLGRTALLLPC